MGSSMNSQEIESRYASLRQARDNGNISDVQFRNDAAQLRLQAPDGFWYQIDPNDGRWLKWNGHTWDKAAIPAALPQVPRKFFPLLGYILKSAWRIFRQQLPMMILFGVLGWLLHTYLLVFINQGFGPGNAVGDFLATQGFGNTLSGTIIWMVVSGFLFGWLGQLIFQRGKKVPKQKQPSMTTFFNEAGGLALAAVLATAGLSLFIGLIVNRYANLTLALGAAGLMLSKGGAVVSLLISSAWSSTYGLAQNKKTMQFSAATGRVAMVGGIAGFLLCTFLPWWGKLIIGIGMLVAAFMLTRRQGQSLTTVLFSILPMMLLLGAIALIMKAIPVLADDGGWKEAGGTFSSWIHSSGAVMAVTQGIGPAVGTMAGPALGQALAIAGGDIQLWDSGDTPTSSPPVVQDIDIDNAKPALLRSSADIGKDNIIQDVPASTLGRQQEMSAEQDRRNNVAQDRYEQEEEFSQVQDYALGIGGKLAPKFITQNELFNNWFEWSEKKTLDFGLFSPIRTVLRTEEVITKSSFSPLSGEATPLNQEELKEAKNEMWWGIFENVGIPVAKIGIIGKLFH